MNHFYMFDITTYIPFLFFSNTLSSGIVQDNIIMCLHVVDCFVALSCAAAVVAAVVVVIVVIVVVLFKDCTDSASLYVPSC